jgi:hypothetical protein
MKAVIGWISKAMFYILAAAVVIWTGSLTVALVARVLPGDAVTPFFALALFDGGAIVWLLAFLFHAEGLPQRGVTLLTMVLDLIGVIGVSMAEMFMGGQQLTAVPEGLGTLVVWGVGGFTAINLLAVYMYHLTEPSGLLAIRERTIQDRVNDEAFRQVEERVQIQAQQLAAEISDGMYAALVARLRLTAARRSLQDQGGGTIIDLPATSGGQGDVPITNHRGEPVTWSSASSGMATDDDDAGSSPAANPTRPAKRAAK